MLVLVSFVLAISGLNAKTYTCPNGQTYDDTTVTFCSNVVHTSSCTLELGGTCEVSAEDAGTSICCFDSSNVIGTGEPTDTTDTVATDSVATDDPDTTVVSTSCDDALRTCYDGCCDRHGNNDDDESESESESNRQLLWGHGNHEGHECRRQCESTWETCSGQSFSSELVDMDGYHGHGHHSHDGDNDSSSEGTSSDNGSHGHYGHGHGSHSHDGDHSHHHHHYGSSSSSSEENEDAYAGGSRILSFFVIPLFIMVCISLCCCCFCKRVKKRQTRDVRTMNSIVSMQKTRNGHIRVPSNEVPINTTSVVGEGTIVTV